MPTITTTEVADTLAITIDVEGIISAIQAQTAAINALTSAITAQTASQADVLKSIAVIIEYWHQVGRADASFQTNGRLSITRAEENVPSASIVPAHNVVLTKIES